MQHGALRSLTERTYVALRADILACRYPPGSRLRIATLCDDRQASLGAVREALSRLASEGLVASEAHKGFSVSIVSRTDLLDLTKARIDIETDCLTRAMRLGGVDWEAEILASLHRLSRIKANEDRGTPRLSEDWAEAHARFHSALVASCDSQWLLRLRTILFEQADRYRRLAAAFVRSPRDVDAEHRALADAVIARDGKRAAALLKEHFETTARLVHDVVEMWSETAIAPKRSKARGRPELSIRS